MSEMTESEASRIGKDEDPTLVAALDDLIGDATETETRP